jgi:hypothetical protein
MALFQPGQSGNPTGRPKSDPRLKELARAKTEEAFAVILDCLADPDKKIALKAAEVLLDRGWGRPALDVNVGGQEDGVPVQTAVRVIFGTD